MFYNLQELKHNITGGAKNDYQYVYILVIAFHHHFVRVYSYFIMLITKLFHNIMYVNYLPLYIPKLWILFSLDGYDAYKWKLLLIYCQERYLYGYIVVGVVRCVSYTLHMWHGPHILNQPELMVSSVIHKHTGPQLAKACGYICSTVKFGRQWIKLNFITTCPNFYQVLNMIWSIITPHQEVKYATLCLMVVISWYYEQSWYCV